ncbi:MAG: DUF4258 domain-containing protein [Deltaproteobacteria bacterium]|nr:DUF4258 domain-containing protein [Deltaproteobacteria bacterium]
MKFTSHAKDEMLYEESGEIYEMEIKETLAECEILEEYSGDKPYPSYLVFGRTRKQRPLHIVCAPVPEDEKLVIITVYQPNPELWIDFKRRKL